MKCYVKGVAYGFVGVLDDDGNPIEDPQGHSMQVLDGKISAVTQALAPQIVTEPEAE